MAEKRTYTSMSEQYVKKSNRRLLLFGLILFSIFAVALFALSGKRNQVVDTTPIDYNVDEFNQLNNQNAGMEAFPRGSAELKVMPEMVSMDNVVLGSNVESVITLTVVNAPIYFLGATLAEQQTEGFKIDTNTCVLDKSMEVGESCNLKVLWNPQTLLQLSNNLTITWRENSPTVFRDSKTTVQIRANSTDSKDCVICETAAAEAEKKPRIAYSLDGKEAYEVDEEGYINVNGQRLKMISPGVIVDENGRIVALDSLDGYDIDENGYFTVNGQRLRLLDSGVVVDEYGNVVKVGGFEDYEVDENGYITIGGKRLKVLDSGIVVDEDGNIVAVVQPEMLPLGLNNKILGTVSPAQDVIDAEGNKLGRLLGDGTIVDTSLTVIGAAVPVVSVMDENGMVFGKLLADGSVVNADNSTIGRPLVDGSVVDLDGKHIGYLRPWGLVVDLNGFVAGGVIPDGSVVNGKQEKIGVIKPNGFAINTSNELFGGIVPTGVAVGAGCQAVGTVQMNGQVKDSFEQVIGRVLPDGDVLDIQGNELGSVVSQGVVINEKGTILGFVNSEGKAVDAKGNVIGCVNPDGSVRAGRKPVGAVMAKGTVVGYGCAVIGSVYPNGTVVDAKQEGVGRVFSDRYVRNETNRITGVVIPRGAAIAEGCRMLGLIYKNGQVVSMEDDVVGCIDIELNVLDANKQVIGAVNYKGAVIDNDGNIIGRIRLDGKVVDNQGKIIGCVNPDGTVVDLEGNPIGVAVASIGRGKGGGRGAGSGAGGVVLDANGNPLPYTIIGDKVYGPNGELIGTLTPEGWVVDEHNRIVGIIPPDGVIFSPDGLVLGRYSRQTGIAADFNGNRFARILPDFTAVSGDTSDVIGALIADGTSFMGLDGAYLAKMRLDGTLLNTGNNLIGAIRADGTVVDKTGQIIGTRIPTGKVLGVLGGIIGTAEVDGSVMSMANTKIGQILGNGLALSDDGRVLGAIFPEISLAIGSDGQILGGLTTKGTVVDKNGRELGKFSPFGFIFNENGGLIGRLIRVGVLLNQQNKTMGWMSFEGEFTPKDKQVRGKVLADGLLVNPQNDVIGHLVQRGVAVNEKGDFVGSVSVHGMVLGKSTEVLGYSRGTSYFYDANGIMSGLIMKAGLVLSLDGSVLGWTNYKGQPVNAAGEVLGTIALDGRVFNATGQLIGTYVAFDTFAAGDKVKTVGVLSATGVIANGKGQQIGVVLSPTFAAQEGEISARLFRSSDLATDFINGDLIAQILPGGEVLSSADDKLLGTVGANGFVSSLTKKVAGGLAPVGVPERNGLSVMGQAVLSGGVFEGGAQTAKTMPNTAIYDMKDNVVGHMAEPDIFIGREGAIIGSSSGTSTIIAKDGQKLASYMPFGSALTMDNLWAGGVMPLGTAVNDDAQTIGLVAVDGAVMDRMNAVVGRVGVDKAVAGITERHLYGTMPYAGGIVKQGLPIGFIDGLLGRTTIIGDVFDAADKSVYRLLDDGTVLGGELPLAGTVVSMNPMIAHNGDVLGTPSGEATVMNVVGEEIGTVATNGAAKKGKYKILGSVVPERLVVNDCKVVGQTGMNGQVFSGNGSVMGRIMVDKWAQDTKGEKIGRVSRNGPVMSPEGEYLGRTLMDSTAVDLKGINLGCAKNDGIVVDEFGNVLGAVVERGAVMDEFGNLIGRVKANGTVVDKDGKIIGRVLGDGKGTVVDENGKVIGRVISPDEEILVNENGEIEGTLSLGGEVRNPKGELLYTILPDGTVVDPFGNVIGKVSEDGSKIMTADGGVLGGILRDKDGNIIGLISGCDVIHPDGTKIGSIMPDGSVMDLNGEVMMLIGTDRKLYDRDGNEMGTLDGTDVNLDKCGVKLDPLGSPYGAGKDGKGGRGGYGAGGSDAAGRRIFIGNKLYDVSENGSVMDKDGIIIGYMGDDGRLYGLNGKELNINPDGSVETRVRPNTDKQLVVSPEQLEQMQQLLAQRRAGMKAAQKTGVIRPNGRILARAKKKQDKDWGEGKIVSTWPVDMSRMILKDKAIPAVLVHSLDSRFPNVPATAIVERHIYSESGRNIIIPAGSRLIGMMSGSGDSGKVAKVDITWERLIRPDGGAFKFSAKSGDAQGRGGVAAYLDNELMKKYGQPVLVSALRTSMTYLISTAGTTTTNASDGTVAQSDRAAAADDARETFMSDMQSIFEDMLEELTGVPPVLFVPSGTRLTVFSNDDLWLRSSADDEEDYEAEFGPDTTQAQTAQTASWVGKHPVPQGGTAVAPAPAEQFYEPNDPNYPIEDVYASEEPLYDGMAEETEEEPVPEEPAGPTIDPLENRVVNPVLPRKTSAEQLF